MIKLKLIFFFIIIIVTIAILKTSFVSASTQTQVQVQAPVPPTASGSVCSPQPDTQYCENGHIVTKTGGRAPQPGNAFEAQMAAQNGGCVYAFTVTSTPCGVTPAAPAQSSMVTTCKGTTISESQLESELQQANYPGPFGIQFQADELAAFNRAACPAGSPPAPSPASSTAPAASVSNNTNTNTNTNTNNSINSNVLSASAVSTSTVNNTSTPQTIQVVVPSASPVSAVTAPQVVSQAQTQAKQLPQTGLPFSGWMLTGLAPLGFKIRKLGASAKTILSANSIWEYRQFSK